MGRRPIIESHPKREEIERHMIEGDMTQTEMAEQYGVSRSAIRWHWDRKIKPVLDEMEQAQKLQTENAVYTTLEALDKIVAQLDKVVDKTTMTHIIKALEARARITGEDTPPVIEIRWGRGLGVKVGQTESDEEPQDEPIEAETPQNR